MYAFDVTKIEDDSEFLHSLEAGMTIDVETSKRYVHLFGVGLKERIMYRRSENHGLSWTKPYTAISEVKGVTQIKAATNTQAEEGGIYVQYRCEDKAHVIFSKDHGKTFRTSFRVGFDDFNVPFTRDLSMCGLDGKGIVLSGVSNKVFGDSYIQYLPLRNQYVYFRRLPYPFWKRRFGIFRDTAAVCRHMGSDEYSIVFIEHNPMIHVAYFAHGILKGPFS